MRPIVLKKRFNGQPCRPGDPAYPDASWHVRLYDGGRDTIRSLQTSNKTEALRRAKALRQSIRDRKWDSLIQTREHPTATIRELVDAYRVAPLEVSDTTRQANINALRQLVLAAGLHGDNPTTAIRDTLVTAYLSRIATETQGMPQTDASRRKRSANSVINQALSLFTPAALAAYQDAGLSIPTETLATLRHTAKARRFRKVTKDTYNPPNDLAIARMLDTWATHADRNLFLAAGLMLSCGLRKAEVTRATWDWITTRDGVPYLDAVTHVKSGTGRLTVRPIDPYHGILIARAHAEGWILPGEPILAGTQTETHEATFRRISEWLTACGWETTKKSHALRAYAGSQVAMRWDIYQAQHWLRHTSVSVTEQHYAHFVKTFDPVDPANSPIKWAAPVSTALERTGTH